MSVRLFGSAEAKREPAALGDARLPRVDWRPVAAALAVAAGYYLGVKVGFALTFHPHPIAVLWPPNAILLGALLVAPVRWWGWLLAAALSAHLVAQLQADVPAAMVLCWYVSNVTEALIGAVFVRRFAARPLALDSVHNVVVFVAGAVLLAPFLSSFLDSGFVVLIGWGSSGYWQLWGMRFPSNMLATLTLVPPIVAWAGGGAPFLRITSSAFMAIVFLTIWGAGHGWGPFISSSPAENALALQFFLTMVGVMLLALTAVLQERGSAEQRLRRSEDRFSTAFRFGPDAMIISRKADGRILDVNDRWAELFGYPPVEVVGRTVRELNVFADEGDLARLLSVADATHRIRDLELGFRTRRGDLLHAIITAKTVEMEGEPCYITIVRDVTEQRRVEQESREQRQQLTHLTRVATVGELSGAMAHELNQPLTAILSNAQAAQRILARQPPDLAEIREILGDIVEADKRAGDVIRRLRALLKKGEPQFARLDLNELLEDVLDLAHGDLVTRNVTVTTRFNSGLPRVNGDRVELQQLFLNLVSNACEAMSGPERANRELFVSTTYDWDGMVQVAVADRGSGIPPDRMDRLFEPFYTTREQGLGLGLAICRTIVSAHSGRIWAENNTEGGATLRVTLPS